MKIQPILVPQLLLFLLYTRLHSSLVEHKTLSLKFELKGNSTKKNYNFLKILDEFHELRAPLVKFQELRALRPIRQDRIRVPLCCRVDPSS